MINIRPGSARWRPRAAGPGHIKEFANVTIERIRDPRPELAAFGERVKKLREQFGMTQRWLGREVGMTSGGLTFLEAGRACPSAEHLERIADAFGVTMDELWRGIGRCEDVDVTQKKGYG